MASGCGTMPWVSYGEPPPECVGFEPGRELEWAGYGTPGDFGLWFENARGDGPAGDIYVGTTIQPHGPLRMWCLVEDGSTTAHWGEVPADWVRP